MPVAEDLGHPAGRLLLDGGAEIAHFREVARENRRVADRFSLAAGVVPQQAVAAVTVELAGWSIAAQEPFGRLPRLRPHPGARTARGAWRVAQRDGLPAVGLAVTHGNAALRLYEAHGFVQVHESLTVDL